MLDVWHGDDHLHRDDPLWDRATGLITILGDWSLNGQPIHPDEACRLMDQWREELTPRIGETRARGE